MAPRPPAGFDPLVTLPGIDPEPGPLRAPPPANPWTAPPVIEPEHGRGEARETMKTKPTAKEPTDAANAEAAKVRADDEHLAVVSAFWEVHDARWRSETREKDAAYYRRGLDKLVRLAARAGHSMVVYTAKDTNDCLSLERAYSEGSTSAPAASDPANAPRFACVKLPKENLHYEDWHLADHSLVKNMPCSEKMRDTKLIWLNKINLVESAGHLLQLDGGAKPTKLEWIDADQYSELDVGEDAKEKAPSGTLGAEEGENADAARKTLTLDEVSQWNAVPSASTPSDAPPLPRLGASSIDRWDPTRPAAMARAERVARASAETKRAPGTKPAPGFKVIEGVDYGFDTRARFERSAGRDALEGWQMAAAKEAAAMAAAHPVLATGGSTEPGRLREANREAALGGDDGDKKKDVDVAWGVSKLAPLPLADRVQMGCYAPKQRVGPCTSNYFVASRFRASLYGVAAMRQAFEDVIFDFDEEFPGPGFEGWGVKRLTWRDDFDEAFDRPGYPAEGAFYAKDGFESGETCWSCICSTEEMIYNKMYRRNRELFNADKNCELTKPYETLAKVGETGESAKAPRRAGR